MADLERAIQIAYEAHAKDKPRRSGEPYVTHPLAVMERARELGYSTLRQIAAVLHDVPENNPEWPISRFAEEGFGKEVLRLLALLTKEEEEDYFDYIRRIAEDEDATAIKILDMEHNSSDNPTASQERKNARAVLILTAKESSYASAD